MKTHSTQSRGLRALVVVAVAVFCISAAGVGAAQVPAPPHEVFGTVTDSSGNAVSGATVEVTYNGNQIASNTTDENGYYEIQIEEPDDGEEFTVTVNDASETLTFETGGSSQVNFGDASTPTPTPEPGDDGDDDAGGGGGGGGGGGAAPAPEQDVEGDAVADSSFDGRTLSTQVETASAGSSVTSSLDDNTVDENLQNTGASLNSLRTTFANDVSNANFDTTYSATNPSEDVPDLSSQTNAGDHDPGDGVAYVNVDTDVAEDDIDSVTFEFSVSRDRLSEAGLEPGEVSLYRYNGGEYTELDASIDSEGDDRVTYTAETPGLSVFAIGAASEQVTATPEPDTATPESDTPVPEPDTDTAQPDVESPAPPDDGPGAVLIGGVVIVVLAVAVGAYLAFGRE